MKYSLTRWARRLTRSRRRWWSTTPLAIAALLITASYLVMQSLVLTPEQTLDRDLGSYRALVGFGTTTIPPGSTRFSDLVRDLGEAGFDDIAPSLRLVGVNLGSEDVAVLEGAWAQVPRPEHYQLRSGEWADEPGEVTVATRGAKSAIRIGSELDPLSGRMPLKVVGTAEDRYTKDGTTLMIGPGTWASVPPSTADRFPTVAAYPLIAWDGQREEVMVRTFAASIDVPSQPVSESLLRAPDVVHAPGSTQEGNPFAYLIPSIAVSLLGAVSVAALAGPIGRRNRRQLVEAGASPRSARHAAVAAQVLPDGVATLIGVAAGVALAVATRPLVWSWHDQPLSPLVVPVDPVMKLVAANVVAIALLAIFQREPKVRRRVEPTKPVVRELRRWMAVASAVCVIWSAPRADSVTGAMILAAPCVILVAALAPDLLKMLLPNLPASDVRIRLGVRQLADRPSAGLQVSLVTVTVGFAVAFAVLLSTMIATIDDRQKPQVLPGQVKIADRASPVLPIPEDAGRVLAGMKQIGHTESIQLMWGVEPAGGDPTGREVHVQGLSGLVVAVETVAQAESLLGDDWTTDQAEALDDGGAIRWVEGNGSDGQASNITLDLPGDAAKYVPLTAIVHRKPNLDWANGAAALTLSGTLRANDVPMSSGALILSDAPAGLGDDIRDRLANSGLDPDLATPYRDLPTPIPNAALLSTAALLALTAILLVGGATMTRVRELRPSAGVLVANGVPPTWARQVLLWQEGFLLALGTILGLVCGIVPVAVSVPRFEQAVLSVPTGQILVLIGSCVVGAAIAAAAVSRRILPEVGLSG